MKKAEVKNIINNMNGHVAVKNLFTFNEEIARLRFLIKSVISRSEMNDELTTQADEVIKAIATVKLGAPLKKYAELVTAYQTTTLSGTEKMKVEAEVKKVDGFMASLKSITNDVLFYMSKLYHVLHSQKTGDKTKTETMEALLEAVSGYEDKLKPSMIREKFSNVMSLLTACSVSEEAVSEAPEATENVAETITSTQIEENVTEAPEASAEATDDVVAEILSHIEFNTIGDDKLAKTA